VPAPTRQENNAEALAGNAWLPGKLPGKQKNLPGKLPGKQKNLPGKLPGKQKKLPGKLDDVFQTLVFRA
jgi:hypothetical protein